LISSDSKLNARGGSESHFLAPVAELPYRTWELEIKCWNLHNMNLEIGLEMKQSEPKSLH
jgi:hypothetical protein